MSDSRIPGKARLAAHLFLAGGVFVLLIAWMGPGGSATSGSVAGPVIRGLGLVVIAWGLLRGAGWAWLLGVVFPLAWVVLGVIGLATADLSAVAPSSWIATVVVLAVLAVGWILLWFSEVRRRYRGS